MSHTIRDLVRAQPGLAHVDVAQDLALLQRLVESCGDHLPQAPLWSHVGGVLGHGSGVSQAICRVLALDPDRMVGCVYCDECPALVTPGDVAVCKHCEASMCQECDDDHECAYLCETCEGHGMVAGVDLGPDGTDDPQTCPDCHGTGDDLPNDETPQDNA